MSVVFYGSMALGIMFLSDENVDLFITSLAAFQVTMRRKTRKKNQKKPLQKKYTHT